MFDLLLSMPLMNNLENANQHLTINHISEVLRHPKEVSAEISKLLERKKATEEKLANLEQQIFLLEGSYLQDTRNLGNILTGWESYLSARSGALKRPLKFKDSDRLFSLSSVTALKNNGIEISEEESRSDLMHSSENGLYAEEAARRMRKPHKVSKRPGRPRKKLRESEEEDETAEFNIGEAIEEIEQHKSRRRHLKQSPTLQQQGFKKRKQSQSNDESVSDEDSELDK